MGKVTGFLEYERKNNGDIPVSERIRNFKEFHTPLAETERREQAARCMNCGVPFCQSAMKLSGMVTGCPLHNLIPEWNDQIWLSHDEHAFHRLNKTSNFPEFTGRVCPALCEKACMNGQFGEPVSVHDNELFLIEKAFAEGYIKPRIPQVRSGKQVAVVGSGPSGLAVADELNHRGHEVTVYEREEEIGGLLMFGIPNMKLDKAVILRRKKLMEEEGVVFRTGVNVGVDITAEELKAKYDAVVLCCGAKQPRSLAGADTEQMKGIWYAVDFLTDVTKSLLRRGDPDADAQQVRLPQKYGSVKGKHVVVVGGGDTGNDCIGTVIRLGAKSVTALEMMPEPPVERAANNPWPEWPRIKKTDYGHEEAIALFGHDPRVYETTVKEFITDKNHKLTKIRTVQVKFQGGKLTEVEGSEKELPCDMLLIAAGFVGCEPYTAEAFGLKRTARGVVETAPEHYAANAEGIFTAGDMHRGQSLVVWAVCEGRNCAREVDAYLMGYTVV